MAAADRFPDDPPAYTVPVPENEEVKIYHLHSPFNPPPEMRGSLQPIQSPVPVYTHTPSVKTFVSYDTTLGSIPGMTTCTFCQQQVLTSVTYKVGVFAWLMCLLFIFCGLFIGCCLIPFCVKTFKDAYHFCPRCHQTLHIEKKSCC